MDASKIPQTMLGCSFFVYGIYYKMSVEYK